MKSGKDEEKILEPMFPRLHVNDADKGGPRAPPRNKMALYEHLTIPSQRFNDHGSLPRNTNTLVPPNQPCGVERNLSSQHLDSSAAGNATEKFVSQISFMENVRTLAQHDQRKTVREEDDFAVPVYINSRRFQCHGRTKSGTVKKKRTTLDRDQGHQAKGSTKPGGFGFAYPSDLSATEEMGLEKSASSGDRVNKCNASLRQESRNRLDRDGDETRVMETDNGVESHLASESHSEDGHGNPNEVDNVREYYRSGEYLSLQQINEEASDDVSDNSMVDSISSIDVSPDDVVGVLGQKRFWRARKAIAKGEHSLLTQQRVFAVQLFELHRLIKVQRLIAASPDVLLDDISYLGKVAAKSFPVKKLLPSEFIVKPPLPQAIKHRSGYSEKTDQHKMECSAENVVGRLSNQGHHQPSNYYMPFASNQPTVKGCYYPPQPPPSGGNQQWLIPVMSPSEGLIYKPHPGPGHTGPVCEGYHGHFMPPPIVMGSFMGGDQPLFHPGVGFPSSGNGYFPPYGIMPTMMNPYCSGQQQQPNEQMNPFVHPGNLQTQQQSSVNDVVSQQQPTKSYLQVRKSRQGSTGSSPNGPHGLSCKKSFRPFSVVDDDENNEPEQMMTTTTTTTRTTVTQTTRDGGMTRVIKVVPHNAKLASENAARIFRSIQEERKHYDSSDHA